MTTTTSPSRRRFHVAVVRLTAGALLSMGGSTVAAAQLAPPPGVVVPPVAPAVTVVPFELGKQGHILVQAEVAGHRGTFVLDTGWPAISLNPTYLKRAVDRPGYDTLATDDSVNGNDVNNRYADKFDVTVRLGTLTFPVTLATAKTVSSLPIVSALLSPERTNELKEMGRPILGILGPIVLAQFETVIDYVHHQLILIPVDTAGRRLVPAAAYTPATVIPMRYDGAFTSPRVDKWSVVAQMDGTPDTLILDTGCGVNYLAATTREKLGGHLQGIVDSVFGAQTQVDRLLLAGQTYAAVPFAPSPFAGLDGLGAQFFRQRGVVGFNFRARQLIFYRSSATPVVQTPEGGIPNRPDVVTVVPFYQKKNPTAYEAQLIAIPASVDGRHGTFLFDTGAPSFFLNRTFLQPSPGGGVDTVTGDNHLPDHTEETAPSTWDQVHVTMRIGTLVDTFAEPNLAASNGHQANAFLNHYWGNFEWFFSPILGNISLTVLEPFETIVDYTRQRIVLIRLDPAGRRLATVPMYTPRWSAALIAVPEEMHWTGPLGTSMGWTGTPGVELNLGILVRPDNTLDTLRASNNTKWMLLDTGAFGNSWMILGAPFLRSFGVVGFNQRTRRFMLYH